MRKGISALLMAGVIGFSPIAIGTPIVIDFGGLGGANGSTFTSYSEDGFTVTKDSGSGCVAKTFGNPVPDVFGGPSCDSGSTGVFSISGAGLFSFSSIDFAANNGTLSYTVEGLIGATTAFTQTGDLLGPSGVFSTIASQHSDSIDTLRMSFRTAGSSWNFDNIALSTVPEPSTLALLGLSLAGLAATRRRKQ